MAEKRMFSKLVIDSDLFLEMPQSSQLLYFHLALRADDDGFVNNPKMIMRVVGAKDDDLKVLAAKTFIIPFESGVVVIKHWKIHNFIRKDTYKETQCTAEKSTLMIDSNNVYQLKTANSVTDTLRDRYEPVTEPLRSCNESVTGSLHSIDKISIDKIRTPYNPPLGDVTEKEQLLIGDEPAEKKPSRLERDFERFWKAYPKKVGKSLCLRKWKAIKPSAELVETMLTAIETQKQSDSWKKEQGQFIPNPHTWLNQGRWEDEVEKPTDYDPYEGYKVF